MLCLIRYGFKIFIYLLYEIIFVHIMYIINGTYITILFDFND